MAHHVEPMDIDSDFDNKENSLHHNNVLPFTEKGYEELDVSELNMKLRYSITPASSPMSKSCTANCLDNRSLDSGDELSNVTVNENSNLTRSLNSTLTKNDNALKSLKALPLQALSTEQFVDNNRSTSVLRQLDSTITQDNANVTVTVSGPSDIDENLSLPSTSSSVVQTPQATTPTNDIPKNDGGSPIMRGLKSVLNMFRSSQSPIPPVDSEDHLKPEVLSPPEPSVLTDEAKSQALLASTPIAAHRKKDVSPTKRSSPHKDSLVFNEDLEKELLWKDETTILFSQERIPIHKLLFQQPQNSNKEVNLSKPDIQDDMNSTVEYMDISYNDSIRDRTMTDIQVIGNRSECTTAGESDGEFVDCETTFTKNESLLEDKDKTPVVDTTINLDVTKETETTSENTSASRLKQIILNTTQDILDATLSITPEDLLPDVLEKVSVVSGEACIPQNTNSEEELQKINDTIDTAISVVNQEHSSQMSEEAKLPILNETINVASLSMVEQQVEDTSVTKIIENDSNLLNETVDINKPQTEEGNKEDLKVSHIKENLLSISLEKEGDISSTETLVQDDKMIDHCEGISTNTTENSIVANIAPAAVDVATNSTSVSDESNISLKEASMTELPADIPLPDEDDIEKELNMPADTTTEPSTGPICLPCDLVGDVKVTSEIPIEGAKIKLEKNEKADCNVVSDKVPSQISTGNVEGGDYMQNSSVFLEEYGAELTDVKRENVQSPEETLRVNVKVVTEVPEIVNSDVPEIPQTVTIDALPDVPLIENIDLLTEELEPNIVNVEPEIPQTITTGKLPEVPNVDVLPKEPQNLKVDAPEAAPIVNVDVLPDVPQIVNVNEDPQILMVDPVVAHEVGEPEELQIANMETISTLNVVDNETLNKLEQVTDDVGAIDKSGNFTVCLNASVTCNSDIGQNATQTAVTPMNINESVIELKPLPDIINQTIAMANVEILESVANSSEQVLQEQPVPLVENPENVTDEVLHSEVVPEAIAKVVPELASDLNVTNIVSTASEITNVLNETLPITPAIEEGNKNPTSNVTETITEIISNEQKNNADEIQAITADVSVSENKKNEDEEIILSENNSPFVSVTADDIPEMKSGENCDVQNLNDQSASTGKTVYTPPASPPITSKGYNFNFDEIDDPFATKTKIRLSPTLDTPTKAEPEVSTRSAEKIIPKKEIHSRRKTQSERKRSVAPKRKFNSDFSGSTSEKTAETPVEKFAAGDINLEPENVALEPKNVTIDENKLIYEGEKIVDVSKEVLKSSQQEESKLGNIEEPFKTTSNDFTDTVESDLIKTSNKTTSSSEQSTYYSAGTSSSESLLSRNVFNLPEIDDMNFNPFATKSKMRESPPPSLDVENPFATKSKIGNTPESSMIIPGKDNKDTIKSVSPDDKMETELMEKDGSGNLSYTTNSSKATDERNATMREINTEDEDTIEGPFLEAEDLNTDDKMSDLYGENIDMMQFGDLPTQGNEDNPDNGELFIDAEAFEFLLNQNQCNTVTDSGKESLFLKFDPLFAKRMSSVTSDGVVAALSKIQKRQSTPSKSVKTPQKEVVSPIAGPSNLNATIDMNVSEEFNDDLNVTVSKPMMVVPPAVNTVTPRNKSLTPNRSNRRSITFTSPAMAVIDRLLSLSGNTSLLHDTTVTQTSREQNEADIALTQLRELLAEKEVHVYTLRSESNELKDRLSTLESHLKSLETESQERLKKINDLNERLAEKTKINKSMAAVVEGCERTIASLISETAQDKKRHAEERIKLINERDEQTAHLASMEVSFSDLHSKYEKSKQVILNCKANEDAYKKSIKEFEENLQKMQNNYELLKQHATSKLNHANQELEKMNKTHEAEVLKLNAMIKRKELHITSLEESLAQKTKANEELTAICDELINKVG